MKLTITNTETTKRQTGEITYAQLCEAFKLPADVEMSFVTAEGITEIGCEDRIAVSFVVDVKPRAKREAK